MQSETTIHVPRSDFKLHENLEPQSAEAGRPPRAILVSNVFHHKTIFICDKSSEQHEVLFSTCFDKKTNGFREAGLGFCKIQGVSLSSLFNYTILKNKIEKTNFSDIVPNAFPHAYGTLECMKNMFLLLTALIFRSRGGGRDIFRFSHIVRFPTIPSKSVSQKCPPKIKMKKKHVVF